MGACGLNLCWPCLANSAWLAVLGCIGIINQGCLMPANDWLFQHTCFAVWLHSFFPPISTQFSHYQFPPHYLGLSLLHNIYWSGRVRAKHVLHLRHIKPAATFCNYCTVHSRSVEEKLNRHLWLVYTTLINSERRKRWHASNPEIGPIMRPWLWIRIVLSTLRLQSKSFPPS